VVEISGCSRAIVIVIAGAGRVVVESWPQPGADADLPARDPPGAAGEELRAALAMPKFSTRRGDCHACQMSVRTAQFASSH
jgi:hypothetical protein